MNKRFSEMDTHIPSEYPLLLYRTTSKAQLNIRQIKSSLYASTCLCNDVRPTPNLRRDKYIRPRPRARCAPFPRPWKRGDR